MEKIKLKKNEERRLKSGHLWIFSNEIEKPSSLIESGDTVEVYDFSESFVGLAFYNKNSLIAGRLISNHRSDDLKKLFSEKIENANNLRKELYPGRQSYRMVFSESDFMPGLIIDKYNDTYILQVYSAGFEKNIDIIVEILREMGAKAIASKNEEYFRQLEGLSIESKVYFGEIGKELISDDTIKYEIDFSGHKTGFYFDQSDNRYFIEKICSGKSVVDAFCNNGGFGLHALKAGAEEVVFVDSSKDEIENVKNNVVINGFDLEKTKYEALDVFDYLEDCIKKSLKFDVVMIDPPAFAKSKKNLSKAVKGYERLNRLALQCIKDNGYLVTSSCSFHLKGEMFYDMLMNAGKKEDKKLQVIQFNNASLDHPKNIAMEETSYLKFCALRVTKR